ncbi:mitochondrial carrier [Rozella allomycis CSF55]|uniref:Mitochondrial carrier n=1 Tax=Rozella allomycis (strain CSF55) TaxID=988480 RepID=A0A075ANT4_ROZAC|nr:Mitochondrial substrate/solute carrier domain-containing protein [Rozella allomycis CSF55]RKP20968.1 mitochondrial carrier [Rozella allomycis CSF55]|eukprot:EPZ31595.1 Mitochondrial substrate/solute carrier domain-containing protein [Rozella allomycis CSF55]
MKDHFIAGGTSAFITCLSLQPLDVYKTRLQEIPTNIKISHLQFIKSIIRKEGVGVFWRGTVPTFIRNVPGVSCYFGLIHQITSNILRKAQNGYVPQSLVTNVTGKQNQFELTTLGNALVGSVARCIAGLVFMPVTILKSESFEIKPMSKIIRDIHQKYGVKGFFRGFAVTMFRDAPFAGLYYSSYQQFKKTMTCTTLPIFIQNTSSAIIAAFVATIITQPFDIVKTRLQLYPDRYKSSYSTFKSIITQNGVRGLFRGAGPRILRKTLSTSMTWIFYEHILALSRQINR